MKALVTYNKLLSTYKSRNAGIKATQKIRHLLPLYPSKRLAGIIGDIFGDGHLQHPKMWRADYTSGSIKELNRFGKEVYLQFGYRGEIRRCTTNKFSVTYNYGLSSAPIGRVLFLCGTPQGNKVLNPTKIPEWILKNKMYFRRFIQRLFDCEATVDKNYRAIGISMAKSDDLMENGLEFFNQLKYYLFKYYKIITSKPFTESKINKRKDDIKTRQIRLKIRRRKSLEIFCKRIGFENETKQHKLILSLKDIGTPGRGGN